MLGRRPLEAVRYSVCPCGEVGLDARRRVIVGVFATEPQWQPRLRLTVGVWPMRQIHPLGNGHFSRSISICMQSSLLSDQSQDTPRHLPRLGKEGWRRPGGAEPLVRQGALGGRSRIGEQWQVGQVLGRNSRQRAKGQGNQQNPNGRSQVRGRSWNRRAMVGGVRVHGHELYRLLAKRGIESGGLSIKIVSRSRSSAQTVSLGPEPGQVVNHQPHDRRNPRVRSMAKAPTTLIVRASVNHTRRGSSQRDHPPAHPLRRTPTHTDAPFSSTNSPERSTSSLRPAVSAVASVSLQMYSA
jgi:hypothetical protein